MLLSGVIRAERGVVPCPPPPLPFLARPRVPPRTAVMIFASLESMGQPGPGERTPTGATVIVFSS